MTEQEKPFVAELALTVNAVDANAAALQAAGMVDDQGGYRLAWRITDETGVSQLVDVEELLSDEQIEIDELMNDTTDEGHTKRWVSIDPAPDEDLQ